MRAKKIAFINGKGGCGKTTSIFHITGVLAERKEKILLIDLDKQRNSSDNLLANNKVEVEFTIFDFFNNNVPLEKIVKKAYFQAHGNASPRYYGVDVIPADIRLEDEGLLKKVDVSEAFEDFVEKNNYDWVLVDMPPSNKMINQICFQQLVEFVLVPFSPDIYSISGYGDILETLEAARDVNPKLKLLGIFLSRYNDWNVDRFIKEQLKENFSNVFIDVTIPYRADIREAVLYARPLSFYQKNSESTKAYEDLVDEILRRIDIIYPKKGAIKNE